MAALASSKEADWNAMRLRASIYNVVNLSSCISAHKILPLANKETRKGTMLRLPTQRDTCGLYHDVVVEVFIMLRDPNTQLEIVELLLKICSKAENYAQQCKKMVLEYISL
ncbi:hypothetical protein GUJ93_ZPchr0008g12322 [Zizania palustris]|uniref:Uncharacterized protein n=1 Tax=Zizania palustris TaxID=103762 RepID=A0A8J5RK00_ZIZPA|nr:hypothetical protein GUJ93_ZPchr0008g12322 [Zizania palustris]